MERGCPPPYWRMGLGIGAVPSFQKSFQFWGLERRILVHFVALLSADCTAAFCTVIYSADAISTHKIRERCGGVTAHRLHP